MLMLATFVALALLAAGLFAVLKGDTFIMTTLLVIVILVVLIVAPKMPTVITHIHDAIDARLPVAFR